MRRHHRWTSVGLLAMALGAVGVSGACATNPIPIPVAGEPHSVAALAGKWTGEYSRDDSKRVGTIEFTLQAGDTTAYGNVIMIPRDSRRQIGNTADVHLLPQPELLTITFAFVSDGHISGALDPYQDPDFGCMAVTTFTGRFTSRNVLEGTFITRLPGMFVSETGQWKATRR